MTHSLIACLVSILPKFQKPACKPVYLNAYRQGDYLNPLISLYSLRFFPPKKWIKSLFFACFMSCRCLIAPDLNGILTCVAFSVVSKCFYWDSSAALNIGLEGWRLLGWGEEEGQFVLYVDVCTHTCANMHVLYAVNFVLHCTGAERVCGCGCV